MTGDRRKSLEWRHAVLALAFAGMLGGGATGVAAQEADTPAEEAETLPEPGALPEEAPMAGQGAAAAPAPRPAPPATEGESEVEIEQAAQPEAPDAGREDAVVLPAPMPRPAADAESPATRPEPGWTLRAVPGAAPVALGGGPGQVASVAVFCLGGLPWLALDLVPVPEATRVRADFTFSTVRVEADALREAGAGDTYVVELSDGPLAGLLAGAESQVALGIDGTQQGPLSLRGSTRWIRAALAECHAF